MDASTNTSPPQATRVCQGSAVAFRGRFEVPQSTFFTNWAKPSSSKLEGGIHNLHVSPRWPDGPILLAAAFVGCYLMVLLWDLLSSSTAWMAIYTSWRTKPSDAMFHRLQGISLGVSLPLPCSVSRWHRLPCSCKMCMAIISNCIHLLHIKISAQLHEWFV